MSTSQNVLCALLIVLAIASVPSHESFVDYLRWESSSGAGMMASFLDEVKFALSSESAFYLFARLGKFQGRVYVGILGCWLPVPIVDARHDLLRQCAEWLCQGAFHTENFLAMACAGLTAIFVLWQTAAEGFMLRNFALSAQNVREGRVWTLLTANISHCRIDHLVHNLLSICSIGPPLASRLPCWALAELVVAGGVSSSLFSLLCGWHHGPSLGSSGVITAMFAAHAALSGQEVFLYGIALPPAQALVVQTGVECILMAMQWDRGRQLTIDVGAHFGGALCGWLLANYRWSAAMVGFGGGFTAGHWSPSWTSWTPGPTWA